MFKLALPKFIKDDFYRKMIALFFATLIWYFVNQRISEVEIFKNVKVDVVPVNTGQVLVSTYKPEISLEIRGPRQILNNLESKSIQVSVEIDDILTPGLNELRILKENIKLPAGLKVQSILTKVINVDVDNIVEKEVDVKVRYTNRLSDKYVLDGEPTVKPERVVIKGASRRLAKINYVDTQSIYIDPSRTTDFSVAIKVVIPEGVTMNYDNVTAYVKLKLRTESRELSNQSIHILSMNPVKVEVLEKASVLFSGPPEILNKLNFDEDIRLFIEVSDPIAGSYEIKFWCSDSNVSKLGISPATVTLKKKSPQD